MRRRLKARAYRQATTIHNAVRVPLLVYCVFMACLYLDTFTLAGAPIAVRRAKLLPPPGFHHQGAFVVVRLLGLALALPFYGVIAYMVAGKWASGRSAEVGALQAVAPDALLRAAARLPWKLLQL